MEIKDYFAKYDLIHIGSVGMSGLLGLPIYQYKIKDYEIFVSEYDFETNEDLRPKDLIRIRAKRENFNTMFLASKQMLQDADEFIESEIEYYLNNIKNNENKRS